MHALLKSTRQVDELRSSRSTAVAQTAFMPALLLLLLLLLLHAVAL
jgi:hypothetical protein